MNATRGEYVKCATGEACCAQLSSERLRAPRLRREEASGCRDHYARRRALLVTSPHSLRMQIAVQAGERWEVD